MMSDLKVWKYPIPLQDVVTVDLPVGAKVLDVRPQGSSVDVALWALVDPEAAVWPRTFRIAGTGHLMTDNVEHISTFQMYSGALVFHVFEVG